MSERDFSVEGSKTPDPLGPILDELRAIRAAVEAAAEPCGIWFEHPYNSTIPPGWLVDTDGRPITGPRDVLAGMLATRQYGSREPHEGYRVRPFREVALESEG